jgi:spermidine synthase
MDRKTSVVAAFLFVSGLCALVYQTVWMRELRLVFGASTPASAAVLAIFMGGLGLGAAVLGRRSDAHPRPLALYGALEAGVAVAAAASPFLIDGIRALYVAAGGSVTLGESGATLLRLLLASLVLLLPTFLMGGTLPAAARYITAGDDGGRRRVALLYATNAAGAVAGVLLATFFLLERYGNRRTLFAAAALNLIAGALAWSAGRRNVAVTVADVRVPAAKRTTPRTLVLVAAALSGLVFLLMELVWYRMLSPILGGTTFMFALVLAVALVGIGSGGAMYAMRRRTAAPGAGELAVSFAAEALALVVPLGLGDQLALLANTLRAGGTFGAQVLGWTIVTAIVVLPASVIAGAQFPLLIALLGRGREEVGRDVGLAYAWNTGGAITGSLLGGFGLLPLLGALGCWRACVAAFVAMSTAFVWRAQRTAHVTLSVVIGGAAVVLVFAGGPTAVWRHAGIGAGLAPSALSANDREAWMRMTRRTLLVEAEGRESSIALMRNDDLGLIVNGKSDGSARADAGTQVMAGMLAALMHSRPRTSMVIGLGTGTTAGWLAEVPSMTRVDVVELEPAIVRIARAYASVNRNALANPKVRITVGDGRERLLVSRARYDIIFSEPSNPYRAGVASLYTREFYEAARARLERGGIFAQWVQMYSIDAQTARTIYATLTSVFPNVQTWTTGPGDVVLIASADPIAFDVDTIRARQAREPFRGAIHQAWRVESAEGLLAHCVGGESVARWFAAGATDLNTDDRPVIEFGFGRTLGAESFGTSNIVDAARRLRDERPRQLRGSVDARLVAANRASISYLPNADRRSDFARTYAAASFGSAAAAWRAAPWEPANTRQTATIAHVLAAVGDERALGYAGELREWQPIEADAITGILRFRQGRAGDAAAPIARALVAYRTDPAPLHGIMESALAAAADLSDDPAYAGRILDALSRPYAAYQMEEVRRLAYVAASWKNGRCSGRTVGALAALEPHPPWVREILQLRALCYSTAGLRDLTEQSKRELAQFEATAGAATREATLDVP